MERRKPDLSLLAKCWRSPVVAREQISRFTGGAISPATMANYDSQKAGPEGRFKIGQKVVYPVDSLISWLELRSCAPDE